MVSTHSLQIATTWGSTVSKQHYQNGSQSTRQVGYLRSKIPEDFRVKVKEDPPPGRA